MIRAIYIEIAQSQHQHADHSMDENFLDFWVLFKKLYDFSALAQRCIKRASVLAK